VLCQRVRIRPKVEFMLISRTQAETVQSAIERRMVETMVSGPLRSSSSAGPVRRASAVGTGLFLVTSSGASDGAGNGFGGVATDPAPALQPVSERRRKKSSGRVTPIKTAGGREHQEQVLALMAAVGPMLWFGHAALVWLKVV
jgi:hypothetical protein